MKALVLLLTVAGIACEVHVSTSAANAPAVDLFDERLSAECGGDGGPAKCEALAEDTSQRATRCEEQRDDGETVDCNVVTHQLTIVRQRLASLRQRAREAKEAAPPGPGETSDATEGWRFPQAEPQPDHGPCKAEKQVIVPERDDRGQPTGKMVATFPGSRTWTDAKGQRTSEICVPNASEIALLPPKDRKPLTDAQLKAQVAAAAQRPKSEMQQEAEGDLAYRRAHGQAPGGQPAIPAGRYEVTGVH